MPPDELPPPYQASQAGQVPMVTCRVCQAMIDISGKRDQHVVKCVHCNEATVSFMYSISNGSEVHCSFTNISVSLLQAIFEKKLYWMISSEVLVKCF